MNPLFKKAYAEAYNLFENVTPLYFDCGELCGKRCCGGDDDTGMILFPHEDEYIAELYSEKNLRLLHKIIDGNDYKLYICGGRCIRDLRPLACRIYPYTPYLSVPSLITSETEYHVIKDPRAVNNCPLIMRLTLDDGMKLPAVRREFKRAVYKAFEPLLEIEEFVDFLSVYSQRLDEEKEVRGLFAD